MCGIIGIVGSEPVAFVVSDQRRGERLPQLPDAPTVRLTMDRETFIVRAGGRRPAQPGEIEVEGDTQLGHQIVAAMAITP